jgi:NAD(P)H-dependent FMN reductase
MKEKKNIFAIIGSASQNSSNLRLVEYIENLTRDEFNITIFESLKTLPHFDPELSIENTPPVIVALRDAIAKTDGVLLSTPEYVFSIPSGLKNAIEWCVSTIIFSRKPTGIITASAHGQKGHDELKLIMQTVGAQFTEDTTLLIQGIKGKIDQEGKTTDIKTQQDIARFVRAYIDLVQKAACML